MSAPICGWVFSVGRALKLPAPQRLVLWAMAERTNPKRDDGNLLCWSSFTQLMDDTGLSRPTILAVVRDLTERALISIQKDGQRNIYRILQPVHMFTSDRSKSEPVNRSKNRSQPVKKPAETGKNIDHEPLKELQTNPARASAHEAATARREPGKSFKNSGGEGRRHAPPAAPHAVAPAPGTTSSGEPIPDKLDTSAFDAFLAERRAARATVPLAAPRPAVLAGEILPPETTVGATATTSVVRGLVRSFRNNPPPRVSPLTRQEQIDALRQSATPPRPIYASAEDLAAARANLAARAAGAQGRAVSSHA